MSNGTLLKSYLGFLGRCLWIGHVDSKMISSKKSQAIDEICRLSFGGDSKLLELFYRL
jgi:hypothetical protein